MTRAALYRQFLAVFVVATLATPLLAQSASDTPATTAPSKNAPAANVEIKTIVSGLPSADDSPLVRSAKIAMLARARYAAEGRKSIALDVRTIPAFGSLGSVPDLGPLAPAQASVSARGPANLVSGVPATAARPPAAAGVAPGYSAIRAVPTTPIAGSVPTSSVGGSVSISSAAGSLRTTSAASSVPMSTPASSVSGTVVP